MQRGVFPDGTFEFTGGALLRGILNTPQGSSWWQGAKSVGFVPQFVADVDAILANDNRDLPVPANRAAPDLDRNNCKAGFTRSRRQV